MDINRALLDTVQRLVRGEHIPVKLQFKDNIITILNRDYPHLKYTIEENEQYAYVKIQRSNNMSFNPEDMAAAIHDCHGNPVKTEEGVITGVNFRGQPMSDVSSTQCLAKKVSYISQSSEYYIATNKDGGLYDPIGTTDFGRSGWIRCNENQYLMYCEVLRTGIKLNLNRIKDELKLT